MPATDLSPNVDNYFIGKGIVTWKGETDTEYRDVGNVPQFELALTVSKLDHFSSRTGIRAKDLSVANEKSATIRMVMEEITASNLALYMLGDEGTPTTENCTGDTTTGSTAITNLSPTTGLTDGATYSISGPGIATGSIFTYDAASTGGTLSKPATATATGAALVITQGTPIAIFSQSEKRGSIHFQGTNDVGAHVSWDLPYVSFTPTASFNPIASGTDWGNIEVTGEITLDPATNSFGTAYWTPN
jgi:hypothetical protein